MIKLSDFVVDFIINSGVKHIFMVSGGGSMHLNDSIGHSPGIEYVCNLHEQSSAIAAETYSKLSENLGVATVTTGPGGTNTITGVAGAWLDSTPCLFISGQVKRTDMIKRSGVRQMGIQEIDIISIVAPITKYAVTIFSPDSIRYHLEKAIYLAKSGRPGPVWIDIPLDVQACQIEPDKLYGFNADELTSIYDKSNISNLTSIVIKLLLSSERPVILVGNGVRLAGAKSELYRLIDRLNIPVMTTWLALDLLPELHPYYIGRPGIVAPRGTNFAIQNSDFILAIGSRLDITITGYDRKAFARSAKKVMVDIDSNELNKLHEIIDLPIHADAKYFLNEMNQQLSSFELIDYSTWMEKCKNWYHKYPVILPEYRKNQKNVSTYVLAEVISDLTDDGDIIVSGSSGVGIEIFLLAYKVKTNQRVLITTALGAMGYGLPASIGACLAANRNRTILIDGDGGFQLNIQELEVVKRLRLPIKMFILNNNGYASIRSSQQRYFGRLSGADPSSGFTYPNIQEVAKAFSLPTRQIRNHDNIKNKILEIMNFDGPVICEVLSPPHEPRVPSISSRIRRDGKMVSSPLEDLSPFLDRDEFLQNMLIPPINGFDD